MGFSLDELEPIITVRYRAGKFDPQAARDAAALSAFPKEGRRREDVIGFKPVRVHVVKELPRLDESWREQAACKGMPTSWWYPERGEATPEADRVCASCPVRVACAEFGLYEPAGTWGGLHFRQRQELRRARKRVVIRRAEPTVEPAKCGTMPGYRRHHYRGQEACEACREANNRYRQSVRARARERKRAA